MNSQDMKEALDTTKSEGVDNNLALDVSNENNTPTLNNKEDVIKRLQNLLSNADKTNKQELDSLQLLYQKYSLQELSKQREAFLADGGSEEDFKPALDPLDEELKQLVDAVKHKRQEILKKDEEIRQQNLARKQAIIEELKTIIDNPDEANSFYQKVKELQDSWNQIKAIPQSEAKNLWNTYHLYIEQFYDLVKLNNEFRAYDFKKNLERKEELCQLAEGLSEEEDIISAFHQLQRFHQQWKEVGPVSSELREPIWNRFKAASTIVNKRHQDYFDNLKKEEEDNLAKKSAICDKIEGINYEELTDGSKWEELTQSVLNLQEEWKTIGFTPKKMNATIFNRYRKACDLFFEKKAEFFKEKKEDIEKSIIEKVELCEIAESLKESTDWKNTSEQLISLQERWKKTRPVYRKQSEELWKRFSEACDYFFDRRNKEFDGKRQEEVTNLEKKNGVIQSLKTLIEGEKSANEVDNEVKALIKEWNAIGHVPFKQKDAVYKNYKNLINKHFDKLNAGLDKRKMNNFKENITSIKEDGNPGDIRRERERLNRTITRMRTELKTYENNLGFLSLSSKKGNVLLDDLKNKMEKLRKDIQLMEDKIEFIENQI